jgi:spermidine synthase
MKILSRCALSSLLAFTGMSYELIYSQWLSAILGGTLFRYSVTIGIFTFCLGLSAVFFDLIEKKYFKYLQLKWINWFIVIVAVTSFGVYEIAFNLSEQKIHDFLIMNFLLHIPIVLIALATGFELPILYHNLPESEKIKILSFDYVGMFIATILFPLLLLPHLGIKWTLLVILIVQFFCFFLIQQLKGRTR